MGGAADEVVMVLPSLSLLSLTLSIELMLLALVVGSADVLSSMTVILLLLLMMAKKI